MNDRIIICPNDYKISLLKTNSFNSDLESIKYYTKKEFFDNYYFSYDYKAIYYLMKKYNYDIDVCIKYLDSLYTIDISKKYKSKKIEFLRNLKIELNNNDLLHYNNSFKDYIKDKEIVVSNYYDLDLYMEEVLNYKVTFPDSKIGSSVYEFKSMEDEVNYVCLEIIKLLKQGVSINNIFLCNVSEEYYYTLNNLFSYYKIPINIPFKRSIIGNCLVQDYLNTGNLDLESDNPVLRKLVSVLNKLVYVNKEDEYYKKIFIHELKNTYYDNKEVDNAVNIKDLSYPFSDSDYVFVLGFNQDVLPKMEKDDSFISDSIKEELFMYDSNYINNRKKKCLIYLLSNISNLYLSYKLQSPFNSYYPSYLISELNLNVIKDYKFNYNHSDYYNKILLGEKLDNYYLYGVRDDCLELLNNHYNIPYNTYDNSFKGINHDHYLTNLDYPLKLSYTSLNTYNECKFKYYIKYVLKLDQFNDTFSSFVGSLYHKILSLYKYPNFDFTNEFNKYLEKRELSFKEKVLLLRIKQDLLDFLDVLKKQDLITAYDNSYYEKLFEVDLSCDVSVKFIGYIDKIMYYKKIEDIYFSIIDYKSGSIDTHIEPMKYGLHMQLPVYLYLIHYSREFTNPIFTGIYYQNILFDYPKYDLVNSNKYLERYYLNGYSTDDTSILEKFDSTYCDSELIKSMKYSDDKGFSRYSKIISNDTLYNMVKFTKKHIEEKRDEIIKGDFSINPKIYNLENVSCRYCSYRDLCFSKEGDKVYLDKVEDLSFLGGE